MKHLTTILKIFSEKRTNCVLLILYLSFISICQIIASSRFRGYYLLFGSCLWLAVSFFITPIIINFFSNLEINEELLDIKKASCWKSSLIFGGISFFVLFIYYAAYFPGAFPTDSIAQYQQVITGKYSDWHPVLHTLFSFWLPLKITCFAPNILTTSCSC